MSQENSRQPSKVTAVIVLYKRSPAESEAFTSLWPMLQGQTSFGAIFRVVLYDNSPVRQSLPEENRAMQYVHDAANGGLAAAYNFAMQQALVDGSEWLLLLDQDTTLNYAYLSEMLRAMETHGADDRVAAITPILVDERVVSPELDFFYHLRHQFPYMRLFPVERNTSGIQSRSLNAYNSGAAIRLSALQSIGGFPGSFRLDYLDHAVFRELDRQGFLVCVLPVILEHRLAHRDLNTVPLIRHTSVLQSQSLFVSRYGSRLDRLLYRLWLLRQARHYHRLCSDPRVWKNMVRQALGSWKFPSQQGVE